MARPKGIRHTEEFKEQKPILNVTIPDFFVEPNICIYCDGDYWHSIPNVIKRDKKINKILEDNNFKVIRFSENQINRNTNSVYEQLKSIGGNLYA